jgi:hypothetical protein
VQIDATIIFVLSLVKTHNLASLRYEVEQDIKNGKSAKVFADFQEFLRTSYP